MKVLGFHCVFIAVLYIPIISWNKMRYNFGQLEIFLIFRKPKCFPVLGLGKNSSIDLSCSSISRNSWLTTSFRIYTTSTGQNIWHKIQTYLYFCQDNEIVGKMGSNVMGKDGIWPLKQWLSIKSPL